MSITATRISGDLIFLIFADYFCRIADLFLIIAALT
jgi:hypothetical protein